MSVDWAAVDRKLPTACTPAGQALRRTVFDAWDASNNELLTLTEVEAGLSALFSGMFKERNFRPAVKCAFAVSRAIDRVEGNARVVKENDSLVDRSEFHGLLVAFRQYLELDVLFDKIDEDGDRKISWHEIEACLTQLEKWNLGGPDQIRKKFPDVWTESMKYEAFAEWCISRKIGPWKLQLDHNDAKECLKADMATMGGVVECGHILAAFKKWDTDESGWISEEELLGVLQDLDASFTAEMARELFTDADFNKDGKIDFAEFSEWISR